MRTRLSYWCIAVAVFVFSGHTFAQKIYWSESDPPRIRRANLDGSGVSTLLTRRAYRAIPMIIDSLAGQIYWVNHESDDWTIQRTNTDGTGLQTLVNLGDQYVGGIALDPVAGKLYWTQVSTIQRANPDGTQVEEYLHSYSVDALALDSQGRSVYWIQHSTGDIWRADLDQTTPEPELLIPTSAYSIQFASSVGKLYWVTASPGNAYAIRRANGDGTEIETVHVGDTSLFSALAVDAVRGFIYWSDWTNPAIMRALLDGTSPEMLYSTEERVGAIAVDETTGCLFWSGRDSLAIHRLCPERAVNEVVFSSVLVAPGALAIDPGRHALLWENTLYSPYGPRELATSRLDGAQFERRFPFRATQMSFEPGSRALLCTRGNVDSGDIRSVDVDSEHEAILRTFEGVAPVGIAVHSQDGDVYWTATDRQGTADRIQRLNGDDGVVHDLVVNFVHHPEWITSDPQSGLVFWTDGGISRCGFDGSDRQQILSTSSEIGGISFDTAEGRLYFAVSGPVPAVRRCNPDGSNLESIVELPFIALFAGITVDPVHGKVYWIGRSWIGPDHPAVVGRANFDGTAAEEIVSVGGVDPRGIVVDGVRGVLCWLRGATVQCADLDGVGVTDVPGISATNLSLDLASGKLYWIENRPQIVDRIWRANLDGSDIELVGGIGTGSPQRAHVDSAQGRIIWTDAGNHSIRAAGLGDFAVYDLVVNPLSDPAGVAIDETAGRIYWTDQGDDTIKSALLDGSDVQTPASAGLANPWALALHGDRMYWIERGDGSEGTGRLRRANLDGSAIENLVVGLNGPLGLAINPSPHIASSMPPFCAIDARQPHDLDDTLFRYGWSEIDLEFSDTPQANELQELEVLETGGDGIAPTIQSATAIGARTLRVTLDDTIEPGAWTCVHHLASGTSSCLGYLPGDVDGDGTSSPIDILRLLDALNGVADPPYPDWRTDVDRSGSTDPADVLRLIDLLNGASAFDAWNGRTLGACP